jgi:hypothetical protein
VTGKIRTTIVAGAMILAAICTSGCGTSSSTPSASAAANSGAEDTTLTLSNTPIQQHPIDEPPKGSSIGDEVIVNTVVRNSASTQVGTGTDICTFISASGDVKCQSSTTLKHGTLFSTGIIKGSSPTNFTFAITGGTGAYDDSHGQIRVTPGSGGADILHIDID